MAMSILLKFLTLKWDISRTSWRIEVSDIGLISLSNRCVLLGAKCYHMTLTPTSKKLISKAYSKAIQFNSIEVGDFVFKIATTTIRQFLKEMSTAVKLCLRGKLMQINVC